MRRGPRNKISKNHWSRLNSVWCLVISNFNLNQTRKPCSPQPLFPPPTCIPSFVSYTMPTMYPSLLCLPYCVHSLAMRLCAVVTLMLSCWASHWALPNASFVHGSTICTGPASERFPLYIAQLTFNLIIVSFSAAAHLLRLHIVLPTPRYSRTSNPTSVH
jgi:hypothetical protein